MKIVTEATPNAKSRLGWPLVRQRYVNEVGLISLARVGIPRYNANRLREVLTLSLPPN